MGIQFSGLFVSFFFSLSLSLSVQERSCPKKEKVSRVFVFPNTCIQILLHLVYRPFVFNRKGAVWIINRLGDSTDHPLLW